MKKYTYDTFHGNYNDFMQAYSRLSYADVMLVCTNDYINNNNAQIHNITNINDIKQYFNTDTDIVCFIYYYQANRLFIMNELLYKQAIYMLCDNAFQYYNYVQCEHTTFDTILHSTIEFVFSDIDNVPLDTLSQAYTMGSHIANTLTDLCFFNKLGGYSFNQLSLHKGNYDTLALFEQVNLMLSNVMLKGTLL